MTNKLISAIINFFRDEYDRRILHLDICRIHHCDIEICIDDDADCQ